MALSPSFYNCTIIISMDGNQKRLMLMKYLMAMCELISMQTYKHNAPLIIPPLPPPANGARCPGISMP